MDSPEADVLHIGPENYSRYGNLQVGKGAVDRLSRCDKFQRAPASSFRGFVFESTVQLQLTAEARVTPIGRGIQS